MAGGHVPQLRVFRSTRTAPNAFNLFDLASSQGAGATGNTIAAFTGAAGPATIQFVPNTSSNANDTLPAVGAAARDIGWRDVAAESAEQVTYDAGTWTLRVRLAKSGQLVATDITVRITAVVYSVTAGVSTEIGRTTMPDTVISGSDLAVTGSFTTGGPTVVAGGSKIQAEVLVQHITAGLAEAPTAAVNVIYYLDVAPANFPAQFTAIPNYSIQFTRSPSDVAPVSVQSAQRGITGIRTASDAGPIEVQAGSRSLSLTRSAVDTDAVAMAQAIRSLLAPRTGVEMQSEGDVAHRSTTQARAMSDVNPVSAQSASRIVISLRQSVESAFIAGDSAGRALIFGRTAQHYFVPTDPPITVPSKKIMGTVRLRTDGTAYLGGATVTLIRDSDGLECATTTSSTVDGSYSFVRDAYDTNTYTTRIKREMVGTQIEEAVSQNGLVPA